MGKLLKGLAVVLLAGLASAVSAAQSGSHGALLVVTKQSHALAIVDGDTLQVLAQVPVGDDPHEMIVAQMDGPHMCRVMEKVCCTYLPYDFLHPYSTMRIGGQIEFSEALEATLKDIHSDHLVARLSVLGNTPLAWRLRRGRDLLNTEAAYRASLIGHYWVEKIEVE